MTLGKRLYWITALVAVLALAGAGVTLASGITSARGGEGDSQVCDQQDDDGENETADDATEVEDGADDAAEAEDGAADAGEVEDGADDSGENDTDNVQDECGDDDGEEQASAGQLDDGKDLLPQASITVDQAIAAAQGAAGGDIGEIDLEYYNGKLVFNVDVGDQDVKVDASDGIVLGSGHD